LVALDLGGHTGRVLEHAKSVARHFGAAIELLYCVQNPSFPDATGLLAPTSPAALEDARADALRSMEALVTDAERTRFTVHVTALVGDPLTAIVEHAKRKDVDLIVMGTHGRTGLTHMFLGSVAER